MMKRFFLLLSGIACGLLQVIGTCCISILLYPSVWVVYAFIITIATLFLMYFSLNNGTIKLFLIIEIVACIVYGTVLFILFQVQTDFLGGEQAGGIVLLIERGLYIGATFFGIIVYKVFRK